MYINGEMRQYNQKSIRSVQSGYILSFGGVYCFKLYVLISLGKQCINNG